MNVTLTCLGLATTQLEIGNIIESEDIWGGGEHAGSQLCCVVKFEYS